MTKFIAHASATVAALLLFLGFAWNSLGMFLLSAVWVGLTVMWVLEAEKEEERR